MNRTEPTGPWVVYRMTVRNKPSMNAMCSQSEWDTMEVAKPGYHTLLRGGIASENEAERLARGTSGDAKSRQVPPTRLPEGRADGVSVKDLA